MATETLYVYFVSFRGPRGVGNGTYDMRARITKRKHVQAIEADLCRVLGEPWVTVISYQFLGTKRAAR